MECHKFDLPQVPHSIRKCFSFHIKEVLSFWSNLLGRLVFESKICKDLPSLAVESTVSCMAF